MHSLKDSIIRLLVKNINSHSVIPCHDFGDPFFQLLLAYSGT